MNRSPTTVLLSLILCPPIGEIISVTAFWAAVPSHTSDAKHHGKKLIVAILSGEKYVDIRWLYQSSDLCSSASLHVCEYGVQDVTTYGQWVFFGQVKWCTQWWHVNLSDRTEAIPAQCVLRWTLNCVNLWISTREKFAQVLAEFVSCSFRPGKRLHDLLTTIG